jgi:hypothetical protein
LVQTIAGDAELMKDGWTHLTLVSVTDGRSQDVTGFCYTDQGKAIPVSPSDVAIFDVLKELRRSMAQADGKPPWVSALFRAERETGKVTSEFEYTNAGRWAVTPQNVRARATEFAPS